MIWRWFGEQMPFAIAFLIGMTLAAILCPRACAGTWVVATVGSYHFDRTNEHNERNLGIGIEQDIARDTRFVAGRVKNSEWHYSNYLGAAFDPIRITEHLRFGAMVGVINGYSNEVRWTADKGSNDSHDAYFPIIVPRASYEISSVGGNLLYMPRSQNRGVLVLQLKFMFQE